MFRPGIHLLAKLAEFHRYGQCTAGIFSGTEQGGYLYRFTSRYSIY